MGEIIGATNKPKAEKPSPYFIIFLEWLFDKSVMNRVKGSKVRKKIENPMIPPIEGGIKLIGNERCLATGRQENIPMPTLSGAESSKIFMQSNNPYHRLISRLSTAETQHLSLKKAFICVNPCS